MRYAGLLLLCLVLVGCGENELSERDSRVVEEAASDISFYCLDGSYRKRIPGHVERLIAIYKKDPGAIHVESSEEQASMRLTLGYVAESLDDCDPRRADQLREAIEE